MPNCFQLYPKGSKEPAFLNTVVDPQIAEFMGVPVHPRHWCYNWHNVIGFLLATSGLPLDSLQLRAKVVDWYVGYPEHAQDEAIERCAEMLRILDFLIENYTSNAFVQIGK